MTGTLSGVTILDLSRVLAGPYATQMLADHGARVVKVEPPSGDMTRTWGRANADGISGYFAGLNRNKQNIVLDLGQESGRDVVRRLVEQADVVVENFKSGTMERWGLSYDELAAINPRLIYCQVSGFGPTGVGPMGGLPALDGIVQAFGGVMDVNGEKGGEPLKVAMPIVDIVTGTQAFGAISAALYRREIDGEGQKIELTLLGTALSILHPFIAEYFMTGKEPQRIGNTHPTTAPYQVFHDDAGHSLFIAGGNDAQFKRFCHFIGADDVGDDPKFQTNPSRYANREELASRLGDAVAGMDLSTAGDDLMRLGVPASSINTLAQALDHEQVAALDLVVERDGIRMVRAPIQFEKTPGGVHRAPGRFGADTRAVLAATGYNAEQIAGLEATGAVLADAADADADSSDAAGAKASDRG